MLKVKLSIKSIAQLMANVDLSIRRYRARFCKRSSAQRLAMQLDYDGGFLFGR